jgi:hypothetical protein
MRKIVLTICSVSLLNFFGAAQITKGSTLLGGSVTFGNSKTDPVNGATYTKQINSSVGLSAGVAIKENLVAGGSLSYGHAKLQFVDPGDVTQTANKSNSYGAGTFLRRYITLGKNFYLFGQAGLNFGISKGEQPAGVNEKIESKGWNISLNAAPGISYALTKKFQLELGFNDLVSLYYNKSSSESPGNGVPVTSKNRSYGLSSSLGTSAPLSIGFRLLFLK